MNSELQEKLLRYLDNDLPSEEKIAFEEEIRNSVELQQALADYKAITLGVKRVEKRQLKQDISVATLTVPSSDLTKYKPSKGGNGFNLLSFVKTIITLLLITGLVFFVLLMLNKLPFKHEKLNLIREKIIEFDQEIIKIDTIYHEVQVVDQKDTVLYGEEELQHYLEQTEGE